MKFWIMNNIVQKIHHNFRKWNRTFHLCKLKCQPRPILLYFINEFLKTLCLEILKITFRRVYIYYTHQESALDKRRNECFVRSLRKCLFKTLRLCGFVWSWTWTWLYFMSNKTSKSKSPANNKSTISDVYIFSEKL